MADDFELLSADVNYLATALGDVLKELEGDRLFELVEEVRALAKRLRDEPSDEEARRRFDELVRAAPPADAERLVRAFTVYFQLVNLAEETHRVRVNRRRSATATVESPRPESVAAAIKTLRDEGVSEGELRAFLANLDLQLTLTAHPTEVKRYTVRLKLERIAEALKKLRTRELPPREVRRQDEIIRAEIATLWLTRAVNDERPTVLTEVKSALYYFRKTILDAVPAVQRDLAVALDAYYGSRDGEEADADVADVAGVADIAPTMLRFRSWIGGDRDGNPYVTPEVMRDAYELQSNAVLDAYVADVDGLVQRLSLWQRHAPHSDRLGELLEQRGREMGTSGRFGGEPYRQWLEQTHRLLLAEVANAGSYPGGADGYLSDLTELELALRLTGSTRAADAFVEPVRQRARAFGFVLAPLDVREHSAKHELAVAELLRAAGVHDAYEDLPEGERVRVLAAELGTPRPLAARSEPAGPEAERALSFLEEQRRAKRLYGGDAYGSSIVSMAAGASDVLEALLLAKEAGIPEIDVTPLFETLDDLHASAGVMRELFAIPEYREHVRARGVQEVMIGYSDSNKDVGLVAANWALYQAQEELAALCRAEGVPLRIFHGRGTSIGRGGGPAGRAILAQPPGSLGGRMRMTEQGEALADRYSDADLAHRHLEQVLHAFILASARELRPLGAPKDEHREAMHAAAAASVGAYHELVRHESFVDFFEQVTPILELGRLNLGSRPTRRAGDRSLDSLRAIPWVFAWTQCRANVPGWYGLGVALAELGHELAGEMYRTWPFFATMLDFAQMSLAKADMGVFTDYLGLADPSLRSLGALIKERHSAAVAAVERVTGAPLLGTDAMLGRLIRLRNPYVDPISRLQVELLRRLRGLAADGEQKSAERTELEYAVMLSLTGVSAGMRNTG